jgi:hypothetical protein
VAHTDDDVASTQRRLVLDERRVRKREFIAQVRAGGIEFDVLPGRDVEPIGDGGVKIVIAGGAGFVGRKAVLREGPTL